MHVGKIFSSATRSGQTSCSPLFLRLGYSESGERLVAGVVPLNAAKTHVLLIQSTRRSGWVIPKGGWEADESCTEAAQREAWEEAGIVCEVVYDLGTIKESRAPKHMTKDAPKSLYQFYEVTVTREEADWPEKHKRDRQWANYSEASEALKSRPELLEALNRSTIQR
jgi:diphosphoinositol-polyphosphate diphosphatase